MATSLSDGGGSNYYEREKTHYRRGLERAILRGVFHGYVEEVKDAVSVLATHFSEHPHDGKQLLDFFPDKESYSLVSKPWDQYC